MSNRLNDSAGYHIKLDISKTFNPKDLGMNDDTRDLSIFVTYIGATNPEYLEESGLYKDDIYVVSRLDPENGSAWNSNAFTGFYGFENNGTWAGAINTINIKDSGIGKSGLKICFNVPEQINNAVLKIFVNDLLQKEIVVELGRHTITLDLNEISKEEQEYLDKAQRILKILLKNFDSVCKKYNLKYYLICGSLLGLVRDHNLIAWDDDVDVAMPRKDFDILIKHVEEEWGNNSDIQFLNYDEMGNNTFLDYMTRIIYMKEEIPVGIFRKIKGKGRTDIENHMPMDIYVLDNASDNEKLHELQTKIIQGLYGLAMGHRAYIDSNDYKNRDEKTQRMVKILSTIGKFIPLKCIFVLYELVRKWYKNKPGENYFESNGFIYCIPWKFKREWFGDGEILLFDDIEVNVPREYKEFLKMHYSNYEQLPPMEARKPTHSINSSGIF